MGAALAVVLGSGVAALATTTGGSPEAALCVADGQPVLSARPDPAAPSGWTCGTGRGLRLVAGQAALDALRAEHDALRTEHGKTQADLDAAEAALAALTGRVGALEARTATRVVRQPVAFAVGPGATTAEPSDPVVGCSGGTALSGSARATGATVTGAVTDDGGSWQFHVRPTTTSPSVELLVVCAGGSTGGTAPPPPVVRPGG